MPRRRTRAQMLEAYWPGILAQYISHIRPLLERGGSIPPILVEPYLYQALKARLPASQRGRTRCCLHIVLSSHTEARVYVYSSTQRNRYLARRARLHGGGTYHIPPVYDEEDEDGSES
jgi:hypothetical protein